MFLVQIIFKFFLNIFYDGTPVNPQHTMMSMLFTEQALNIHETSPISSSKMAN